MPIGSVLRNDYPTNSIQWFSIIWPFQTGRKIVMNGYLPERGGHDSEFGWTNRRRQNDVKWIRLVARNKFSLTVSRIQVWRIAGTTAYVMNCNLWPCDWPNINTAQFWEPVEQSQHDKAKKYQKPLLYDIHNHGDTYISARPVGNNVSLTHWGRGHLNCLNPRSRSF